MPTGLYKKKNSFPGSCSHWATSCHGLCLKCWKVCWKVPKTLSLEQELVLTAHSRSKKQFVALQLSGKASFHLTMHRLSFLHQCMMVAEKSLPVFHWVSPCLAQADTLQPFWNKVCDLLTTPGYAFLSPSFQYRGKMQKSHLQQAFTFNISSMRVHNLMHSM